MGGWWDYRRIAGRARSHTTERKWETFRLFGTLQGHLAAHRHPELGSEIVSPLQAAGLAAGTRVLAQPRHPRRPERPASWWDYGGPLVLVYNGGPAARAGELVLPVRLPQGAGRWSHLAHYLDRPERWHKVDLVRRRDACRIPFMANLALIYGMRLLPADDLQQVGDADIKLKNGNTAHVTMHVLEGSKEEIEKKMIDAGVFGIGAVMAMFGTKRFDIFGVIAEVF